MLLIYNDKKRVEVINSMLVVIINVGLISSLIHSYGVVGVAFSIFASLLIVNVLRYVQIHKMFGITLPSDIVKKIMVICVVLLVLIVMDEREFDLRLKLIVSIGLIVWNFSTLKNILRDFRH